MFNQSDKCKCMVTTTMMSLECEMKWGIDISFKYIRGPQRDETRRFKFNKGHHKTLIDQTFKRVSGFKFDQKT